MPGTRLGIGVLGLEMREHRRIVFGAEPFVRILEGIAVVAARDGATVGDGRLNAGFAHRSTVSERDRAGMATGAS
ncbi:hypothetical protein GCM10025863_12120 [Microbacterium suwonense]|uniref:Uncharacterized protein n=1 Tax=Microbacterium suwonense TaxID=683047 RepID=A0ABM8FSV1_9MICO|nr:hypothetical protein GCM10025863_12120 [Microbacterium suwonense]